MNKTGGKNGGEDAALDENRKLQKGENKEEGGQRRETKHRVHKPEQ